MTLYLGNQMRDDWKKNWEKDEEYGIRWCITDVTWCKNKFRVCPKNRKLKNLSVKRNIHKPSEVSWVTYKINCDEANCMMDKICQISDTKTKIKEGRQYVSFFVLHWRHQHSLRSSMYCPNFFSITIPMSFVILG